MDGRVFAIDKTFSMTQTLVDLVGRIYPPPDADPGCEVDQGTILLLLSCANRVFDVYEVILGHMRGCIKHKLTPVTSDGKTLLLPQLRIGSFAPPTPTAMAVHMLMVVLMASNLFEQLQQVLGVWMTDRADVAGPTVGARRRSEVDLAIEVRSRISGFIDEARSEVSRRASAVAGEILSTRQLLLDNVGQAGGLPT